MVSSSRTTAFARLLRQHQAEVYAFILASVPNWADADEIQQETNVRLWEQFDKYIAGSDFGAWARTIARFQIMTQRRTKLRERDRFSDAFVDDLAGGPKREMVSARGEALAGCLQRLPEHSRELLRLYYEPDAQPKDVAKQRGRTLASLRLTLFRIRRTLRECIERQVRIEFR